jgi:hypothetical protein
MASQPFKIKKKINWYKLRQDQISKQHYYKKEDYLYRPLFPHDLIR